MSQEKYFTGGILLFPCCVEALISADGAGSKMPKWYFYEICTFYMAYIFANIYIQTDSGSVFLSVGSDPTVLQYPSYLY